MKKKRKTYPIAKHIIAEFYQPQNMVENSSKLKQMLLKAAKSACSTPLKTAIHKFPINGITGIILLAESHITIHTWPEIGYIAIDVFTCGKKTKPEKAINYFRTVFKPKKVKIQKIIRNNV